MTGVDQSTPTTEPLDAGRDAGGDLAALASAHARAVRDDVPTYAPTAYGEAVSAWEAAVAEPGGDSAEAARRRARAAMAEAEARAAAARPLLAELVRERTAALRGSLARQHAPELVADADERYRLAVAHAERAGDGGAADQAEAARDALRNATARAVERGPLADLEAAVGEAAAWWPAERVGVAETELAALHDAVDAAGRGAIGVAELQRRLAVGRRRIGLDVGDLADPGHLIDPDGPVVEPGFGGAPAPVTQIDVWARTADSLTLSWWDPSGPDTTHTLFRRRRDVGPGEAVGDFTGSQGLRTHVDTGLEPDTLYTYVIQSQNWQGFTTTPMDDRGGGYTRDGRGIAVWRAQLRIRTADVPYADTEDPIHARLDSPLFAPTGNGRWLDYGPRWEQGGWRDDFDRGRELTYDLDLTSVGELSDITMLTIRKQGSDAVAIAELALLVNNQVVFGRHFGETAATCLWLDEDDGHSPSYTVGHQELRTDPRWAAFADGPRPLQLSITNAEIVDRIEGMVGHAIHGTDLSWDIPYPTPRAVTATYVDDERLKVRLQLEAALDLPFPPLDLTPDPAVDVDFDLRFTIVCDPAAGTASLLVTSEGYSVDVNPGIIPYLLLPLGIYLDIHIAETVREQLQPIMLQVAFDANGLCPTVQVRPNGDLVFST